MKSRTYWVLGGSLFVGVLFFLWRVDYSRALASCGGLGFIVLGVLIAIAMRPKATKTQPPTQKPQNAGGTNGDDGNTNTGPAQTQRVRPARRRWTLPTIATPKIDFGALAIWIPGLVLAYIGWSIGDYLDAWGITPLALAKPITWLLTLAGLFAPWAIRWAMRARRNYEHRARPNRSPGVISPANDGSDDENLIKYLGAGSTLSGIFGLGVLVALSVAYWALAATINDYVEITATAWVLIGAAWAAGVMASFPLARQYFYNRRKVNGSGGAHADKGDSKSEGEDGEDDD